MQFENARQAGGRSARRNRYRVGSGRVGYSMQFVDLIGVCVGLKSARFLSPRSRRWALTCGGAGPAVASAMARNRNSARADHLPVPAFLFIPHRISRRELEAALTDARGQLRRHKHELQTLREKADALHEAAETLIHHTPARERFTVVHELRDRFPARRICRITVSTPLPAVPDRSGPTSCGPKPKRSSPAASSPSNCSTAPRPISWR